MHDHLLDPKKGKQIQQQQQQLDQESLKQQQQQNKSRRVIFQIDEGHRSPQNPLQTVSRFHQGSRLGNIAGFRKGGYPGTCH